MWADVVPPWFVASLMSLLATVLWAIPHHDELDRSGQSSATIDSLLAANLVRSFALTVVALTLTWVVVNIVTDRTSSRAIHRS